MTKAGGSSRPPAFSFVRWRYLDAVDSRSESCDRGTARGTRPTKIRIVIRRERPRGPSRCTMPRRDRGICSPDLVARVSARPVPRTADGNHSHARVEAVRSGAGAVRTVSFGGSCDPRSTASPSPSGEATGQAATDAPARRRRFRSRPARIQGSGFRTAACETSQPDRDASSGAGPGNRGIRARGTHTWAACGGASQGRIPQVDGEREPTEG